MRQLATLLITLITLAVGLSISLVVFAVLAMLGSIAGLYFWWKTRALRKHLKEHIEAHTRARQAADGTPNGGAIIEGEWRDESGQATHPVQIPAPTERIVQREPG